MCDLKTKQTQQTNKQKFSMILYADNVSITRAETGKSLGLAAQPVYTNRQAPGNVDHSQRPCFPNKIDDT